MRSVLRWCLLGLPLGLLFTSGCSFDNPIDISQKIELTPTKNLHWVENTGATRNTKVKISVKVLNNGPPVDVAVVYKEEFEAAKTALKAGQEPPKQLACNMNTEAAEWTDIVLEANRAFVVLVRNPSKEDTATVQLEVKTVRGSRP